MKTTKSSKKAAKAKAAKSSKKTAKAATAAKSKKMTRAKDEDSRRRRRQRRQSSCNLPCSRIQKMQPRLLLKKFPLKPSVHSWDAIFPNIRPDSGTKISENFPGTKLAIFSAPSLAIYVQIVGQKSLAQTRPDSGTKIPESFLEQNCQFFFGRHLWQYSGTKISENFPGTKFLYVQIVGQKSLAQIRPDSGTKIPESFLVQNCQFFGCHLWQYSGTKISENFPVGNIHPDSGTEAPGTNTPR